ncbi:LysR family transcriptional regulator [Comamonadaceae bacterium OH2545_COT-014]|nr:LysR family transcriptional regulator [Comamonadaceae bacterium OH2545_COT-014]
MRYTFKQLEYFVAVAECGTIAGAAEKVHVSPPSISVAIAHLEEALELRLFIRQHHGLQLTESGEQILGHTRALLEKARSLQSFSGLVEGELRGKVTLGSFITLAPQILPEICRSFANQHPGVSIELMEASQDQLIGHLRRGIVDLAITYEMHIPQDLWFEPLVGLPPLVMLDAGHRLAGMAAIDMKELEGDPYILLDLPISRDYFLSIFEKSGVSPNVRMKTTHFEVVRSMVANGIGVSISVVRPVNNAALDGKPIVCVPIANPLPMLNVGVLSRRSGFSPLVSCLKKQIQQLITAHGVPGMAPLPRFD